MKRPAKLHSKNKTSGIQKVAKCENSHMKTAWKSRWFRINRYKTTMWDSNADRTDYWRKYAARKQGCSVQRNVLNTENNACDLGQTVRQRCLKRIDWDERASQGQGQCCFWYAVSKLVLYCYTCQNTLYLYDTRLRNHCKSRNQLQNVFQVYANEVPNQKN